MKITTTLGGIVGAAQPSTALFIARPQDATDIGLTGVGGLYLLWSVPLGSFLGVLLGLALLRLWKRSFGWRAGRGSFFWAMGLSFLVAPLAPGMLGLAPQPKAQLWQGLAVLSLLGWVCVALSSWCETHPNG